MNIFIEGGNTKLDNNDFILKIVAELEQKGIKTGFDKLKKELEKDPAKIDVILDTSGTVGKTKGSIKKLAAELHNELSVEISKLQKQGQDINFDLSVGDVEEVIQNVINHTRKLGESFDVASDKAQKFLAKFNKKSGGVLINSDEFKAVQEAINGLGNTHTIEDLNKAMNTLEVTYDNMSSKLRNSGKSLNPFINAKNEMATMNKTIEGISLEFDKLSSKPDDVANAIKELSVQQDKVNSFTVGTMEWADAYGHLQQMIVNVTKDISNLQKAQSSKSLQPRIDEIQLSMDNGYGASEYQNRINTITASLEKYGVEAEEAKKITSSLQSTFDIMKGLSSQGLVTQADKLEQEFKAVKVSVDQAKLSYDKLMQPASKEKISSTLLKVQKLLDNNTKITENVKNEWQSYVNRLSSGSDIAVKEINDINIRLKQTESNMRSMGKLGLSWTDKLTQAWEKFGGWGFATGTMMTVINQLRQIPKEVYAIDTAMTNLYKVTDETDKKYQDFLNSAKSSAVEIGRSVSSLIEQTADWAKLGFDIDTASTLAKTSSIYANVGEVDDATAVSDIVTAIKAFNIEASDSITIVDKFNKLGNEFATDAKSLGDGLSRSASAMATAGTDINKTLAMLTGGTEITQNASEFGNFLKVGSMRIRGMKGQLEQLGEEVDETVDSISKVQTQILNRTGGKVNIFDDNDNFRDYYEIMEDISKVFNDLNDPDKADLTEILFGKQRGNQGAALIQAFQSGQIQKAYEAALNAEGSAMQEQERWMGSLEAKLQQFKASFQSFSDTVLNSDLLKWFVDLGKTGVNSLNALFKALGSVGTAGLGGAGISAFLGRDKSKQRFCPLWM